ncbi:MAG: PEGA domain-containing protein [Acidobacteria bacterium]|nr:PEGA domain-containing protein [Acidobacteriota bacterium]
MAEAITRAGRYQIVSELGRGSMGVVYQGFDPLIGRTVAIKTMLVEGLAPAEFEEFKARLQNILPVETIIPMYEQVCSALDHAHHNKVIHRDIKPSNIMILESGLVKVTDFGIAKLMSMGMTQAGQILGTPNYMSPEQVKGRGVDGRSDIFSLGVILYELVTGEKPFSGQNITTVIYKIIHENPISPRELDATIHPGLSYVISRALAKDPHERYQSCRELAEDLKNYKNLGGATAPSATVVVRVPPIQAPPAAGPLPEAKRPAAPSKPPRQAGAQPAEPRPSRPLSVHVVQPQPARAAGSSAAVWVLLFLLLAAGGGGAYYYLNVYRPAQLAPKFGQLIVSANIPGATITIDGKSDPAWTTPYAFSQLPVGWHVVEISIEGYQDLRHTLEVTEGGAATFAANLIEQAPAAASAMVTVTSNVSGANITLDGQSHPTWLTPYTFSDLAMGEHKIVVSKKGYHDAPQTLTVEGGPPVTFPVNLTEVASAPAAPAAPKFGQLVVTSNISGATIRVDGNTEAEWVTPYTFSRLSPGRHNVVVTKSGYSDVQRVLEIEGGRTGTLNADLAVPSGAIAIESAPAGAQVFIDGRLAGTSPVEQVVGVGQHTYEVRLSGMGSRDGTFTIREEGHIVRLKVPLVGDVSSTGIVEVRTIPPGATVYVDGKPVGGTTPTNFRVPAGSHTLTISLSGHRPVQKRIEVPANQSTVINERLSSQ